MADYSTQIRQLSQARRDTEQVIKDMEAASKTDRADRSHSIARLKWDVASYDRQLAEIEAAIAKETPSPAFPEKPKPKK